MQKVYMVVERDSCFAYICLLIDLTCMLIYTDSLLIVCNIMKLGSSQSAVFTINLHVIDSTYRSKSCVRYTGMLMIIIDHSYKSFCRFHYLYVYLFIGVSVSILVS